MDNGAIISYIGLSELVGALGDKIKVHDKIRDLMAHLTEKFSNGCSGKRDLLD